MHAHREPPIRFPVQNFIRKQNFQFINPKTGRKNTYNYSSSKVRAIASARKTLPMGATVVFCANKRGHQGAMGLAEELLKQLDIDLDFPRPLKFCKSEDIQSAIEYLEAEFGELWLGTRMLKSGAIIHHGDIPQEAREILEKLLREGKVSFGICTNTLAEGVNLPIRSLVLYSVQRLGKGGARVDLLTRDIKNLVGRAGRAGSSTKGLVININPKQWPLVKNVADQAEGEPVRGALKNLVERLAKALAKNNMALNNKILESNSELYTLTDGVDATLIELLVEEVGEDELIKKAEELADQTFASKQADQESRMLLREVFALRACYVIKLKQSNKLEWITETGARARMIKTVENDLYPQIENWSSIDDPTNPKLLRILLEWSWTFPELIDDIKQAYRLGDIEPTDSIKESFFTFVKLWINGNRFQQIAASSSQNIDDVLGVYGRVLSFSLQTILEQGIAILTKILESKGELLADAVCEFPEHLRFGVPTRPGRLFAKLGVRHRWAYVELGSAYMREGYQNRELSEFAESGLSSLLASKSDWKSHLGGLVFENTLQDLKNQEP